MSLFRAQHLNKTYHSTGRVVKALDDVGFELDPGECLAILGETGSGKSTLGKTVLGIEEADSGRLEFLGERWPGGWKNARHPHRLDIQPVFQNPQQSLNPRRRVIDALRVAARERRRKVADAALVELLERVGLRPADKYLKRFPRELSGGELQRVAIARALSVRPSLIVADEPTSALDVSIRAGVLNVLRDLQQNDNVAILLITHDILVARAMSTQTVVMKSGRVVEHGATDVVLGDGTKNEYTRRLIAAVPEIPD